MTTATATILALGMTCHRGSGKTLWEIVEINEHAHTVQLSALGKGGYTNKHASMDELTNVQPQRLGTPLHVVLADRKEAKAKAASLDYRLRFCQADNVDQATQEATNAAYKYANSCRGHTAGLADLGIKES